MENLDSLKDEWAGFLHKWGLTQAAIVLLDGLRPLTILMAQVLRMGVFMTNAWDPSGKIQQMADMLEDDQSTVGFIESLRHGRGQE